MLGIIPAHAGKTSARWCRHLAGRDHPRSRGENGEAQVHEGLVEGSSPLTRGKHGHQIPTLPDRGIIPAHAGKTYGWSLRFASLRDHPRSRGENVPYANEGLGQRGSSPLTRGKPELRPGRYVVSGIIPAHAGKTIFQALLTRTTGDHPRSRGENETGWVKVGEHWGSSPLTRGKRTPARRKILLAGIIPAHAGKTSKARSYHRKTRDHPRSRGENGERPQSRRAGLGSSPLTRGKLRRHSTSPSRAGIIPAHAGKTSPSVKSLSPERDHPRSRGENLRLVRWSVTVRGSSPLTRGKRPWRTAADLRSRIIPAHAGKTAESPVVLEELGDHPRSRGENLRFEGCDLRAQGSSPLTRGKPGAVFA